MKKRKTYELATFALAAFGLACHESSASSGTPVFREIEANDDVDEANDFGSLLPGDHFIIRGDITDDPWDPFDPFDIFDRYDPFDGFSFYAPEPIYVEFELYTDSIFADLDICIYDPLLGEEVGCFQTDGDPEVGGVEVEAGNVFHLVVESYTGDSGYDLELRVFNLYYGLDSERAPSEDEASPRKSGFSGLAKRAAVDAGPERQGADATVFQAYGNKAPEPEPVVERVSILQVDPETGETTRSSMFLTADGRWMGIHGEPMER